MTMRLLRFWIALLPWVPLPVWAAHLPLDPATLAGAGIFTAAEQQVAAAAAAAGLAFIPDSRPLPPQVILPLDTADGRIRKRNGLLYWRGDMLPDQLAPGESGTFFRRHLSKTGAWKTVRKQENAAPGARPDLVPVVRATAHFTLPAMIIETPYQLGILADRPVRLVLWRTAAEDSAPIGGFLDVPGTPPAFLDALKTRVAPFEAQSDWAAEFNALAP